MIRSSVVIAVLALASSAYAEPTSAQAEVLFRQGRELLGAGHVAEACAAFEQSQKLEAAVSTLLNLASCREKNGQLATAWGLFVDAERQTHAATDAPAQQLHGVAQDRATKLEPHVSKLTIAVASRVDGLEIARGGEQLAPIAWNQPQPVDGGTYTITARAPGKEPWSAEVTVGAAEDTQTIDVPELTPRSLPHTVPALTVPLSLGTGALALGGAGLGFELVAESAYGQAKAEMASLARRNSLYAWSNTQRHIAQGFAAGGLLCAGAALWLYVQGRHAEDNRTVVVATPVGVGVAGRF
jgi:hypothetical protein